MSDKEGIGSLGNAQAKLLLGVNEVKQQKAEMKYKYRIGSVTEEKKDE